jgi:hypothetical protein
MLGVFEKCITCNQDAVCQYCARINANNRCCSVCGYCKEEFVYAMKNQSTYICQGEPFDFDCRNDNYRCTYCFNCTNCKGITGGVGIKNYDLDSMNIEKYVTNEQVGEILEELEIPRLDGYEISIAVCNKYAVERMLLLGCEPELFPSEIIKDLKSELRFKITKTGRK